MPARYFLIATCLMAFLIPACVPLPQYSIMKNDLEKAGSENERRIKELDSSLKQAEEKLRALEAANDKLAKDASVLEAQNRYLKKINQHLAENNKAFSSNWVKKGRSFNSRKRSSGCWTIPRRPSKPA
jgi:peptidoglycan hydrolase CwlO-like protein